MQRFPSRFFVTSVLAAALAVPARGYNDTITHPLLSRTAVQKSVIHTDPTLMFRLGLLPADRQSYTYRLRLDKYLYGLPKNYSVAELIGEGSFDEDKKDDLAGHRSLNHFFDPVNDKPLTIAFVRLGKRSWEWILEPEPNSVQLRSLSDAREFLYRGLTFNEGSPSQSRDARATAMGTMFLSLGHVIHHIQDMAQPQHVRNDDHLDDYPVYGLNPFFNPSRYEYYTRDDPDKRIAGYAASASAVYPGSSEFKTAKDFWTNIGKTGLADYTNANFVSHKTNFTVFFGVRTGTYNLPVPGPFTDISIQSLLQPVPPEIATLCSLPVDCMMSMYSTVATQRASTRSIFDQDLQEKGVFVTYTDDGQAFYQSNRLFALNRFNHDAVHPLLIQRAVSYSAGIINHFFRGKLDVEPPLTGPYAVVDHRPGSPGFNEIKATVRNATPNEALMNGTVQAIASFHRNDCYQDDLSGEFQLSDSGEIIEPCPFPGWRSVDEIIRPSNIQNASFAAGESKQMTFTFADPIPINATDLVIRVLFKGKVGEEEKSFALGAADVSEATFITVMNGTDTFELNANGFFYHQDIIANITQAPYSIVDVNQDQVYSIPPDVDVRGGNMSFGIFIDNKRVADVQLPEGRFARVAALVSAENGFILSLLAQGAGFNQINSYAFAGKVLQFYPELNTTIVSVVGKLRSQFLHFDSVTFYRFFPATGTPLEDMPVSRATDADKAVAVTLTAP